MTDTCAYCGLGIVPVPESVTGFRHAYQETDGHDAGPDIDPEYPPTAADLDPAVARLARERDAAMWALKRIKAMSAVAGYDFGDASIHNVARQTITAIETGAIHDQ